MDSNYLVQRRINAQKKYRRKVTAVIALGAILLVLIIVGLVKVILDENAEEQGSQGNGNQATAELTPGAPDNSSIGGQTENNGGNAAVDETAPTGAEQPTEQPQASQTPTLIPTLTPTPVVTKKVAIDPGHGGNDLGSTRQGLYEKDANLAIALYLQKILEEKGYEIYMVRDADVAVENTDRPVAAIENNADIYVSIHLNSLDADSDATQGAEVWYADKRGDGSDVLAQYVVDELTKEIDTRNRGIKMSNNLIVLKYNEMPACLVECGFITSETERAKLFDPEYQKKIAEGIANGIMKFLPLE